ncbi:hypothetical protein JP0180_03450 [Helicobacter pylori]
MSEALETLDKDKQAIGEAIGEAIKKDKEGLARAEADENEEGYEKDKENLA